MLFCVLYCSREGDAKLMKYKILIVEQFTIDEYVNYN